MTKISTKDVQALARLSALRLDDSETESLAADIERILEYFELLGEIDTDDVSPTYYGTDLVNVSADDEVSVQGISREALIGLSEGGSVAHQVKVPKVL